MRALRQFLTEHTGFVAAEKVLITLLALGIIMVVARFVLSGSTTAATNIQNTLQTQTAPKSTTP